MCTSSSCLNSCHRRVLTYHSHNIPALHSSRLSFKPSLLLPFRLSDLLKPKMFIIITLLFCWNLRNSITSASIHNAGASNSASLPFFQHPYPRTVSSHPSSFLNSPLYQHHRHPSQLAILPLGGTGIAVADETAMQIIDPVMRSPSSAMMIPLQEKRQSNFDGGRSESDTDFIEPKRKKACAEPSVATRSMLGANLNKRSYFAFTQDEVDEKVKNDEYRQASERRKREVQHNLLSKSIGNNKRTTETTGTDTTDGTQPAAQPSPLPWACKTTYQWQDMGVNHYPRFVRTAECTTRSCFNGFFRCRPRRYKTKVLKRNTPTDSASCEEEDVSLPESLRPGWRFVTVTLNLCCDCTGRLPGSPTNPELLLNFPN